MGAHSHHRAQMTAVSGTDLTIEALALRHAPMVQRLASDPLIAATTLIPQPYPADGAERYIRESLEAWRKGWEYRFAVIVDGEVVGTCALKEVHEGQAELGYWIGVPYWGRGYATQGARCVVQYAFTTLGLNRLVAHTLVRNPASGRVLEKLGFECLGEAPNPFDKWAPDERIRRYRLHRTAWCTRASRA